MLTDEELDSMLASNNLDDLDTYFSPNIMGISQYEIDSLKEMM